MATTKWWPQGCNHNWHHLLCFLSASSKLVQELGTKMQLDVPGERIMGCSSFFETPYIVFDFGLGAEFKPAELHPTSDLEAANVGGA